MASYVFYYPTCVDIQWMAMDTMEYSDKISTSETTRESAEGEANLPSISCATSAVV